MAGLIVACVPNQGEDLNGAPVLKITGEPVVNNAVSVDLPIEATNLTKLAFLVEEYVVTADGKEMVISGYNALGEPVISREVEKVPATSLIFNAGRKGKGKTIENVTNLSNLHISGSEGLDRNKKFVVYIAAIVGKSYYTSDPVLYPATKGEIFMAKFETPEKYSDDDVTVIRQHSEGLDLYVQFPEVVRQRGNAIKWGVTDLATARYQGLASAQALYLCDYVYPDYLIEADTTIQINHHNAWRRIKEGDHAGEIGYYEVHSGYITEYSAEDMKNIDNTDGAIGPIQYFYEFLPGAPMVLYFGEVAECTKENGLEANMGWSFGDSGLGWYWFPYDIEQYSIDSFSDPSVDPELYWYTADKHGYDAWHKKITLTLDSPAQFDGNVAVNISNLRTNGATVTFSPDDRTYQYVVGILEASDQYGGGFDDITRTFLDGKEEYWQWFSSSEVGFTIAGLDYYLGSQGMLEIKLEEYLRSLTAGGTYHIVVNAIGSKMGANGQVEPDFSAQNFQHIEFQFKEYSTPEPELIITALESDSPWKVKYNIKNPNLDNPVEKVVFAANYTREWKTYMEYYGYTYYDMTMMNTGFADFYLSETDVILVNSEVGAEVEFDVLENSAFTVAVLGWNSEGRASNPNKVDANGNYLSVAEAVSLKETAVERLESYSKIEALAGNWTASATVMTTDASGATQTSTRSWDVVIGDLNTNEVLSNELYALLEQNGYGKEQADILVAEYNAGADNYNKVKIAGQNRMLCQGWSLDDDQNSTLRWATPWDLFGMSDYNAPTVDYLFHDFGPKWFLQVDQDGNVFVPVHYNRIQPMTRWTNGMDHYLCGFSPEANYAFVQHPSPEYADNVQAAGLPVGISEDKNTIVIGSYEVELAIDDKGNSQKFEFFPNVLYDYYGSLYPYSTVVASQVVLTRKSEAVATPAAKKASAAVKGTAVEGGKKATLATEYKAPNHPYSRSLFLPKEKQKVTKITTKKPLTPMEKGEIVIPGKQRGGLVVSK